MPSQKVGGDRYHVHIACKYNGGLRCGPLPLAQRLSPEKVKQYQGTLTRGRYVVVACTCSDHKTNVTR